MELSPAVIGAAAASVGVPIIFGLLRQANSLQPKKQSDKGFDQLGKEYGGWEVFALVPFFIFTPAIGLLLWYLQKSISDFMISGLGESVFLLPPTNAIWWLPAIFISIFLAAIPMHYLYLSILGRERYAEYTEYTNLKHGMDGWILLRYMAYVMLPICICFSLLAIDSYLRVTEEKFISNDLLSLGAREYEFGEIERIDLTKSFKAPNGNIVHRSFYSILFIDGYEFSFDSSVSEIDFDKQQEVISYILENSTAEVKVNDPYPE
jgi:hypothetical protein